MPNRPQKVNKWQTSGNYGSSAGRTSGPHFLTQGYSGEYSIDPESGQVVDTKNPNWFQRNIMGGNRELGAMQQQATLSKYNADLASQKQLALQEAAHKNALEMLLYKDAEARGVTPTPEMVNQIKQLVDAKSPEFAKQVVANMQGGLDLRSSLQNAQKSEADLSSSMSNVRKSVVDSTSGRNALIQGTEAGFRQPYLQNQATIAGTENTQAATERSRSMLPYDINQTQAAIDQINNSIASEQAFRPAKLSGLNIENARLQASPVYQINSPGRTGFLNGDIVETVEKPSVFKPEGIDPKTGQGYPAISSGGRSFGFNSYGPEAGGQNQQQPQLQPSYIDALRRKQQEALDSQVRPSYIQDMLQTTW